MSWFTDDNKTRKSQWPVWDYMFKYFPLAFLEEVRVAVLGNKQHNPGQPLHWARDKSTDQLNTAMRHQFDYAKAKAKGVLVPRDSAGNAVLAQAIWRLKAQLQLDLEQEAMYKVRREDGEWNKLQMNSQMNAAKEGAEKAFSYAQAPIVTDFEKEFKSVIRPETVNEAVERLAEFKSPIGDNYPAFCKCGHRQFWLKKGDLPPTVIAGGETHSLTECFK